jgi:hypothetical protein
LGFCLVDEEWLQEDGGWDGSFSHQHGSHCGL